jgi:hypothetical protein
LAGNALSVPAPSPAIRCRGAGAPGLPASAGQEDRAQPSRLAERRPLRALAVSGGQGPALVHSRRRVRRSGQPGLLPGGRCAGRAGAGRPLRCRRGPVRSARSVVRPRGAPGGVRTGRGGRGRRSGTGLQAAGPRGAVRARRSWSGRSPHGGPRRPGREAGAAGAWRAARPRPRLRGPQQRSASAHQAPGEPRPRGRPLRGPGFVPSLAGRADGPGSRVSPGELLGGARVRVLRRCAAYRVAPDEEERRPGATGPAETRPGRTGRRRRPGRRLRRHGSPSAPAGR